MTSAMRGRRFMVAGGTGSWGRTRVGNVHHATFTRRPGRRPDADADDGRGSFRVLATCGVFEPGFRGGGPVRSVANIVDTAPQHIDITLVTGDHDLGCRAPYPGLSGRWVNRNRARVFYLGTGRLTQWWRLWRDLRDTRFDLLYVNSLWSPVFTVIPVLAARLGLIRVGSVLLAPRGELSPGALSLKSRKKRLFLTWWGRLLKDMDVVWHASSDKEDAQIRAVCRWASVAVNQDQVALSREPLPTPSAHAGPPRLVFIGRVSPMKNVDLVLHALRDVSGAVEFDIYGPLEDAAYWSCCRVLIARLPAAVKVRYRGELAPGDVCRTFSAYDAFVLPTKGENFGHAIAESLSASCPVVCSDQTPWTAVLESGGGSVVRELTAQALAEDLRRILAMTPDQRVHAKLRASDAYRAWRDRVTGGNILDQVQGVLRPGRR